MGASSLAAEDGVARLSEAPARSRRESDTESFTTTVFTMFRIGLLTASGSKGDLQFP